VEELIALVARHGVSIVFVATLAARVGAPVPAGPLLVVAGGLSAVGQMSTVAVFASALLANMVGDAVWFAGGRRWGQKMMRLLCRISLSPDICVQQSESLIQRWGGGSLIAAKFVPGVSVVAAPMAGALHMPWRTFIVYGLAAAALWTSLFLGLGLLFHHQIARVLDVMSSTGSVAVIALVAVVLAMVAWRWWRRRHARMALGVPRVAVDELRALLQQGHDPLILDVRAPASVEADGRVIPGAVLVTLKDLPEQSPAWPREREIVIYCNCPNEASAAVAAQRLLAQGFRRARPLAGGLDAWFESEPPPTQAGSPETELRKS
jgi:membrane protein DedA with SNARE-associated domain/rhodanese-related sulfurtransferase